MAIILDHTSSGNITLKGPQNALPQDNFTFTFPNVTGVSYVLTSGTSINSISGLQLALDSKVNTGDLGTAAYLNYGTQVGNVVRIESDGKISNEILPQLAITDTFLVNDSGYLTGLNAQKGDIAILTGLNPANYILISGSATDIDNWYPLAIPLGSITSVNNIPPSSGNVEITASGITYANSLNPSASDYHFVGQNLKTVICYLNEAITGVTGNYLTCSQATGILENYVLTGYATGVFNSKANLVHTHPITEVVGLSGCLDSLKTFLLGSGGCSVIQNSSDFNICQALGNYSAVFGYGAKAVQNFEIAHAAGFFQETGDAQSSKIVFKCTTSTDVLTEIASVCIDLNTMINYSAYVVGKTLNKYAVFKIDGSAIKNSTHSSLVLSESVINEYVNTTSGFYVDTYAETGNGTIKVKVSGDPTEDMKWLVNFDLIKIKN
jgi:hypothetical protein